MHAPPKVRQQGLPVCGVQQVLGLRANEETKELDLHCSTTRGDNTTRAVVASYLDVAVHDVTAVQVGQRIGDCCNGRDGCSFIKAALLLQALEQLASLCVLQYKVCSTLHKQQQ